MNTHYAVRVFSGDPDGDHEDEELRGRGPTMTFVACGPEDACWTALARDTEARPLRKWEEAEVLARDPALVRVPPCSMCAGAGWPDPDGCTECGRVA